MAYNKEVVHINKTETRGVCSIFSDITEWDHISGFPVVEIYNPVRLHCCSEMRTEKVKPIKSIGVRDGPATSSRSSARWRSSCCAGVRRGSALTHSPRCATSGSPRFAPTGTQMSATKICISQPREMSFRVCSYLLISSARRCFVATLRTPTYATRTSPNYSNRR